MSSSADWSGMTTAAEMARAAGIDTKRFRAAFRGACLPWHSHNRSWIVRVGSAEHADMQQVLTTLTSGQKPIRSTGRSMPRSSRTGRSGSDEAWIIDICDEVLGKTASRQHRFPFLLEDPGPSGCRASLPVDAYYPDLRLVIEYHERQHTQRVALFVDRATVSGVPRGEQRHAMMTIGGHCCPSMTMALSSSIMGISTILGAVAWCEAAWIVRL